MNKRILFTTLFLCFLTIISAKDLSIRNLITKPALTNSNVLYSDIFTIAKEWGTKVHTKDNKYIAIMSDNPSVKFCKNLDSYYYRGAKVRWVEISYNKENKKSQVSVLLECVDEDNHIKYITEKDGCSNIAHTIRADLMKMGIKMPPLSGGISRRQNNLPKPFLSISINSSKENYIILTYEITKEF